MYNAFIKPIMLYNSGSLDLTPTQLTPFDVLHRKHLRHISGYFYPKVISNIDLYKKCDTKPISATVTKTRWQLFGHILRLPENTPAQKVMSLYFSQSSSVPKTRTRTLLPQILHQDINKCYPDHPTFLSSDHLTSMRQLARNRKTWQSIVNILFDQQVQTLMATLTVLLGKRRRSNPSNEAPTSTSSTTNGTPDPRNNEEEETTNNDSNSDTYTTEPNQKRRKRSTTTNNKRVRSESPNKSTKRSRQSIP